MASEIKKEIELEIAHVLFIDNLAYSKLLINEQRRLLELINQIARGTEQFRNAEANNHYRDTSLNPDDWKRKLHIFTSIVSESGRFGDRSAHRN
jgi:hypothetical protein